MSVGVAINGRWPGLCLYDLIINARRLRHYISCSLVVATLQYHPPGGSLNGAILGPPGSAFSPPIGG